MSTCAQFVNTTRGMAPNNSKNTKSKDGLEPQQQQNRPYSAKNVFDNLHGAIGMTQVQKSLDELADKGLLTRKDNKKQRVYWVTQQVGAAAESSADASSGKEQKTPAQLEEEAKQLKEQVAQVQSKADALVAENKKLAAQPGDEEAAEMIARLTEETSRMREKLEGLRASTTLVSKEELQKADTRYNTMKKAWKARKRMCRDICDMMGESSGKSFAQLAEEMGLETDEDAGIHDIDDDESTRMRKRPRLH